MEAYFHHGIIFLFFLKKVIATFFEFISQNSNFFPSALRVYISQSRVINLELQVYILQITFFSEIGVYISQLTFLQNWEEKVKIVKWKRHNFCCVSMAEINLHSTSLSWQEFNTQRVRFSLVPLIFRYDFQNKRTITINLALHAQTYTKQFFKRFHLQRKSQDRLGGRWGTMLIASSF